MMNIVNNQCARLDHLTAMDKEAYAIPFLLQTSTIPKGLVFSL